MVDEGDQGVEMPEGAIWADLAMGAVGAIRSEGAMKAVGCEWVGGLRGMRGLIGLGTEENEAAMHMLLDG